MQANECEKLKRMKCRSERNAERGDNGEFLFLVHMAESSAVKECRENRAIGSLLGVLIGDALGLGYQWYYDLDEKEKDFGSFVQDYVDPRPDGTHGFAYIHKYRYDEGVRAGDTSQNGQVRLFSFQTPQASNRSHLTEDYSTDFCDVVGIYSRTWNILQE